MAHCFVYCSPTGWILHTAWLALPSAHNRSHQHHVDQAIAHIDAVDLKRADLEDVLCGPTRRDKSQPQHSRAHDTAFDRLLAGSLDSNRENGSHDECADHCGGVL